MTESSHGLINELRALFNNYEDEDDAEVNMVIVELAHQYQEQVDLLEGWKWQLVNTNTGATLKTADEAIRCAEAPSPETPPRGRERCGNCRGYGLIMMLGSLMQCQACKAVGYIEY